MEEIGSILPDFIGYAVKILQEILFDIKTDAFYNYFILIFLIFFYTQERPMTNITTSDSQEHKLNQINWKDK